MKGVNFKYNQTNILELLASETARLADTPLNKLIPFR